MSPADVVPPVNRLQLQDPVLRDRQSFLDSLDKYCDIASKRFDDVLTGAARLNAQAVVFRDEFCSLLNQGNRRSVYNSTILTEWIVALERGMRFVQAGASAELLDYYTGVEDFRRDAALEFPELHPGVEGLRACVHERINIIPLDQLVGSPRMGPRVEQSMPGYPGCQDYLRMDAAQLDRVADHIDASLDLLRELAPEGYACLLESVHSIYVSIFRTTKNTMGGRDDSRGSIVAGISEERIDSGDIGSTAAELYHEHCHLKLSIFCCVHDVTWPAADNLISPFKNENRNFKWALHTAYSIGIECAIRLNLLEGYDPERRRAEVAFLAAVSYRLEILLRAYRESEWISIRPEFAVIGEQAGAAVSEISRQIESSIADERAAHHEERDRVIARHVWDVGQFLLRDIDVEDPGLGEVKRDGDSVVFEYNGTYHRATTESGKHSTANYGRYLDTIA